MKQDRLKKEAIKYDVERELKVEVNGGFVNRDTYMSCYVTHVYSVKKINNHLRHKRQHIYIEKHPSRINVRDYV